MMILPRKEDAIHKAWLFRILEAIADDERLPFLLYFKGGTCASMLGWLDRFSVDLDFDYVGSADDIPAVRDMLAALWYRLGLQIKDASKNGVQYFLCFENEGRNTIKIDTAFPPPSANTYAPQRFEEIDRVLTCQTKDTAVANKLIALSGRKHCAGRDVYDVHYFLLHGYPYNAKVIEERSGKDVAAFFSDLLLYVEKHVTEKLLAEDLSYLLPYDIFSRLRKVLKREVMTLIKDERARLKGNPIVIPAPRGYSG